MTQLPKPIVAVEIKDLAAATDKDVGTIRAAVHKGGVDGAFYEYSYPQSNRAKIHIPIETALLFMKKDHTPVDASQVKSMARPVIPDTSRNPADPKRRRV